MQSPGGSEPADLAEVAMHKATIDASNNAADPRAAQLAAEAKTIRGQARKLKPGTYAQLGLLAFILLLFLVWHLSLIHI